MTSNKDLKRLIRARMHKTGESYTAARRLFLRSKEASMTTPDATHEPSEFDVSIDRLQLTLRTARALKRHAITTVGDLAGKTESELADIGLTRQSRTEIRDVLASRGM